MIYYALHETSNVLKIGCSRNPRVRVSKINGEMPGFVLIATEPGGHGREQELLRTFAPLCVRGFEWFRYEQPLRTHVESLATYRDSVALAAAQDEREPGVHVFGWIDKNDARLIACGSIPAKRTMRREEKPVHCYNCRAVIAVPWQ